MDCSQTSTYYLPFAFERKTNNLWAPEHMQMYGTIKETSEAVYIVSGESLRLQTSIDFLVYFIHLFANFLPTIFFSLR